MCPNWQTKEQEKEIYSKKLVEITMPFEYNIESFYFLPLKFCDKHKFYWGKVIKLDFWNFYIDSVKIFVHK